MKCDDLISVSLEDANTIYNSESFNGQRWKRVYQKQAVDEAIVELKAENEALKKIHYASMIDLLTKHHTLIKKLHHQKIRRAEAMARWCRTSARYDEGLGAFKYRDWYWKWFKRWLEIADKLKEEENEVR